MAEPSIYAVQMPGSSGLAGAVHHNKSLVPKPLAEQGENAICTFDVLIDCLKSRIQKCESLTDEISIDTFLKNANYELVNQDRCTYQRRWLISEEDVCYENMSTDTTTFTHTCQSNQESCVSLQTSRGHKIGISGGLGVSAFGESAGLNANYQHSRAKTDQQNEGQGKSKISTVEVKVELHTATVVKELVYKV